MKTLKRIIFVILLILFILFCAKFISQNNQGIVLKLFSYQTTPIPLYVIVIVSFGIGLLLITTLAIFGILKSEFKLIRQRKKIDKLEKKLHETSEVEEIEEEDKEENEISSQQPTDQTDRPYL